MDRPEAVHRRRPCTRYAPKVFESGDDSLACVKDAADHLLTEHGGQADVPEEWRLDARSNDGVAIARP